MRSAAMVPAPSPPPRAPGPTNVVILSKIPEGISEQQIAAGAGRYSEVLQVSYRPSDLDGPGWAIVAFASPELAKAARERLDGKPLAGGLLGATSATSALLEAALGEGLYGNLRGASEQDSPWKEARTSQGQVYYYHTMSRQTSWTKPPPDFSPAMPGVPPPPAGVPGHLAGRPPFVVPAPGARPPTPLPPPNPGAQAQVAIQAAQAAVAAAQTQPGAADAASGGSINAGPVGANLFIYHIPNSWDDTILRQHFEHFGKIVSCRVQKDGEGRPRGFGFVSYDAPAAAQAAIAGMHGFPVEGKHLKVQLKKGDEQQLTPQTASVGVPQVGGLLDIAGGLPMQPPPPPGIHPMNVAGFTPARPPAAQRPGPY